MTEEEEEPKGKRRGKTIETNRTQLRQILTGTLSGLTPVEIAKQTGLTTQTIQNQQITLQPLFELAKQTETNRLNLALTVEGLLNRGLSFLLSDDAWSSASLTERATAIEKLHKIMRLEKGQSTTNIAALLKTGDALDE